MGDIFGGLLSIVWCKLIHILEGSDWVSGNLSQTLSNPQNSPNLNWLMMFLCVCFFFCFVAVFCWVFYIIVPFPS